MSVRICAIAIAAFLVAAITVTVIYTSLAASSAAAEASNYSVTHRVPNYMLRWESPLLARGPVAPVLGK